MHVAVRKGKVRIVELLIENGADVEIKNSKGLTALALAERYKNSSSANIEMLNAFGLCEKVLSDAIVKLSLINEDEKDEDGSFRKLKNAMAPGDISNQDTFNVVI